MNKIILIVVVLLLTGGVYVMLGGAVVKDNISKQDDMVNNSEINSTDSSKEKVIGAILEKVSVYNSKDIEQIRSYVASQGGSYAQSIEGLTDNEVLDGVAEFLGFWGNPTEELLRDQQTEWVFEKDETIVKVHIPQTNASITLILDEQGNWR